MTRDRAAVKRVAILFDMKDRRLVVACAARMTMPEYLTFVRTMTDRIGSVVRPYVPQAGRLDAALLGEGDPTEGASRTTWTFHETLSREALHAIELSLSHAQSLSGFSLEIRRA